MTSVSDRGPNAMGILEMAMEAMIDRAVERDKPDGERSMGAAVAMFEIYRRHRGNGPVTEVDGWRFMEILKMVRGDGLDEFVDGSAYAALAGEAAMRAKVRKAPEDRG